MLFHFKVSGISGGFIGVDIFFVISGYLMTSIIFNKFSSNTFSLKQFYFSRFNRIAPALFFMIITCLLVFYFILFDNEFKNYVNSLIYTLSFTSNIYFYKEAIDYFTSSIYSQYLLHTWSLSVEFQFYILYPLILLFCKKFISIKYIKYIVLIFFVCSLGFSLIESYINPTLAYYILPTRSWQLLAGALVFLFPLQIKKHQQLLHYVFFFAILLVSFFITDKMAWPGIYSMIPILLTVCFLYTNYQTSLLTNNKVMQFLGKISYSLYLYHWPLVIIYTLLYDDFTILKSIYFIVLSVCLASISYYFIEQRLNKKLNAILFISFLLILIFGSQYIQNNKSLPKQIEKDLYSEYTAKKIAHTTHQSYVYIMGDSFADKLTRLVNAVNRDTLHYNTIVKSIIRCYVSSSLIGYRVINNTHHRIKRCKTQYHDFNALLKQEDLTGYIFIWTRRWEIWLHKHDIEKWYSYFLNNKPLDIKTISSEEFENIIYTSIDKTLNALDNKGAKVIIVLQVPRQKVQARELYTRLFRLYSNTKVINQKLKDASISRLEHIKRQKTINTRLVQIASKYKNVSVFDPTPFMCDEDKCLIGTAEKAFYTDNSHMSRFSGADKIITALKALILQQ